MEKLFNHTSIFVGIVGGIIAGWLGGWDMLLKTIVFLAVADYVTGVIKHSSLALHILYFS